MLLDKAHETLVAQPPGGHGLVHVTGPGRLNPWICA